MLAELAPGGLPPLPVGMIERAEQQAALRAALEDERSIVVIQGLGGTGKTSLALDVAHQVRGSRQFGTAIWTSARDTALTFEGMLRQIARGIARADIAAVAVDELEPTLHPELRARSLLLVVDNFETIARDEQASILGLARWLNPSSRMLLTSRHADFQAQMPDGAPPLLVIPLGGLSEAEARALFGGEVERRGIDALRGRSERRLGEIFELTGGHPLAIRLLVAEAQTRSLVALLRDLRSNVSGPLDALFEYTWKRLGEDAWWTLQAASLLGGPASRQALAAMTNLTRDAVDRAADELERVSLLELRGQQVDGTPLLGLHPLTRGFVRARVEAVTGLTERLMDRAARFYLEMVGSNSAFMNERGHEQVEREREAILAVRDWCHANGRLSEVVGLGRALGNVFWVRGWARERITSGELARDAAARLGWAWEEGEILSQELGWAHLQLDELDLAQDRLDEARVLLEAQGHVEELASCWRYLGQIARRRGDYHSCQTMLERALEAVSGLPEVDDRAYAEARTATDFGYLRLAQGHAAQAADEFRRAVDFFSGVGDEIRMAYALNGLGDAVREQHHTAEAAEHYTRSLEIADHYQSRPDRVRALLRLATLHAGTGTLQQAIDEATEAQTLARQLGLLRESRAADDLLADIRRRPCPVWVDVEHGLVKLYGADVHLEPLAVELLGLLNEKQGELCSHVEIRTRLWPVARPVTEARRDVHVLVHDIREAIKRHAPELVKLHGVHGRGYMLEICP